MPIHVKIKLLLKKVLPENLFKIILKIWRNTFARFFVSSHITDKYKISYIEAYGTTVAGGPFAGMLYITESVGSVLFHKIIGYYEEILHPHIEKIKKEHYDTIIDIGCAEGYYLAGLGRALPQAKLIGYDIDENALSLTQNLILKNNLTNTLILKTTCTAETLKENITEDTLLICDAEGFENEILDVSKCPALAKVKKLIVETHDFAAPNVVKTLQERFSPTHDIESITFTLANPDKYPFLKTITNKHHLYQLLRERGEQEQVWLIMTRK